MFDSASSIRTSTTRPVIYTGSLYRSIASMAPASKLQFAKELPDSLRKGAICDARLQARWPADLRVSTRRQAESNLSIPDQELQLTPRLCARYSSLELPAL